MGQYYKPINLKTMEWVYSHNYDDGLKLMEHSWIGNEFVGAVMTLLSPNNLWHKMPIVWCGDYYDEEGEEGYYQLVKEEDERTNAVSMSKKDQLRAILVNHTKKEYVVYSDMREDEDRWRINPLPLLTALGNNRGGGDYRDGNSDFDKVGIWARDILSIEFTIPKGFKKLEVDFFEGE